MLEVFRYDFMIRAFAAGIIVGVVAPIIGIFLVVRRYSLLSDTLSHVSLVGVAGSLILKVNPILGALIASVLAAIGMESLRENKKLFSESILAVFLSGSLSLALILLGIVKGINGNLFSYLFGSITTVSKSDIYIIGFSGLFVILTVFFFFKKFFLISLDEELSKANGLSVKFLNLTLTILAAITVSLSMRVVGVLLIGALMVIPVLTAMQLGKGFAKTFLFSVLFSLISVIIGLYSSYYLNLPSGGTIVLFSIILFLSSFLYSSIAARYSK